MKFLILKRILTNNLQKIPLLYINFNRRKYRQDDAKGSCDCVCHPALSQDGHIKETMSNLCDYIRENYDMDKVI